MGIIADKEQAGHIEVIEVYENIISDMERQIVGLKQDKRELESPYLNNYRSAVYDYNEICANEALSALKATKGAMGGNCDGR